MKKFFLIFLLLLISHTISSSSFSSVENNYMFSIDLTLLKEDKLTVTLIPPTLTSDEIIYRMPKIVPGTYEVYDFGRFVSNFSVFDKMGKFLPAEKMDENSWRIKNATSIGWISYEVEDTWDSELKENYVFEPAGTNFEDKKNMVLNTHGIFGYIEGMKSYPYILEIKKPENFYGSTGLSNIRTENGKDIYTVPTYMELADSPIMYSIPDTTTLNIGGAEILVSVYSPNKKASSKEVAKEISRVLHAQKEYLGGALPITKYAFIIYLFDGESRSGATGALEHSYSSFYYIRETGSSELAGTIIDFGAHEFFHIVTPLSIHSEEIGNFDYNDPAMSRHLWMYEGVTEYSAGHVQVKSGMITPEQYLNLLRDKIQISLRFNDTLPFTELSLGCLGKYKEQYGNVYYKGALIGMCLDIKLRSLSEGKYGIQNMMGDLAKTYGKEKSFKDEELFDKITALTYPEIRVFLNTYVSGKTPLPLQEIFSIAGVTYSPVLKKKELSFGGFDCISPEENRLCINNPGELDEVGRNLGYKAGDIILKLDGLNLNLNNAAEVIGNFHLKAKEGDAFSVTIQRRNHKGKNKKVKLKGKVRILEIEKTHVLAFDKNPTEKQQLVKKTWLGL